MKLEAVPTHAMDSPNCPTGTQVNVAPAAARYAEAPQEGAWCIQKYNVCLVLFMKHLTMDTLTSTK